MTQPLRGRLRRLGLGLATLSGLARLGYFIPYRHAAADRDEGYPALAPLFTAAEPAMAALLDEAQTHAPAFAAIAAGSGPARFDQDWFPRLDAVAAYTLVRRLSPARILEVGSGHSTRFMARAVADAGLATRITCIDPAPRAGIAALNVEHIAGTLSDVAPERLPPLATGDILFVDSSHVAMPGSDVDRLLLELLPRLPAGVVVHVHDVLLPDPYPPQWRWRGYNEQLLVAALLVGGGFDILFSSHWAATRMANALPAAIRDLPLPAGALETSLWLVKH